MAQNQTTLSQSAKSKPTASMGDEILSILPHAVLVVGAHGEIEFANSAAEHFLEISVSILKRSKLSNVFPFDSPLLALVAKVRALGVSVQEYDVDIGTIRIGTHTVDILVNPMNDGNTDKRRGEKLAIILHERGMADKMTRQLTHQGAARSVRAMSAILAHEIKNPLAGISGAAQLLETVVDEEDTSLTRLIREESDRICKLVDRMEVFTDNRPIETKPVNIHVVLKHVVEIAENSFAADILIKQVYDPSLPEVPGDRDQLVQVFLNLVKNAADAVTPTNGEIVISTAYRPGMRLTLPGSSEKVNLPLEVCVCDNGGGVASDLLPHLFDPFVTTKTNGSGLGLALVAKIIGDHGGVIDCQSSPRQTIFRTLLPMQPHKSRKV